MKRPKTQASYPAPMGQAMLVLRLTLAGLLAAMVLAQLFAFERFPEVLAMLLPDALRSWSELIAVAIVTLEVAAVPSLVIVPLSRLARWVSRIAGLIVVLVWYGLMFSGMLRIQELNSGLFGSKVFLPANFLGLMLMLGLFVVLFTVHVREARLEHHSQK